MTLLPELYLHHGKRRTMLLNVLHCTLVPVASTKDIQIASFIFHITEYLTCIIIGGESISSDLHLELSITN